MKIPILLLSALLCVSSDLALGNMKLPAIISDHMVLKKANGVPIWGKAAPGEEVTVTLDGQTAKATTDAEGKWKVLLNLADSGPGPFSMTVQGQNTLTVNDVVVGAVWVAGGQSNMEWPLRRSKDAEAEIAASTNPLLRQFEVAKSPSPLPKDDCQGRWVAASPETSGAFSAVGYYFGKVLQNELQIPVGVIHSSWGGTGSEPWTSESSIDTVADLKTVKDSLHARLKTHPDDQKQWVAGFTEWLKTHRREDTPSQDKTAFTGPDVTRENWESVKIPGFVKAGKVSGLGAVWIRAEFDIDKPGPNSVGLDLGEIEGFESVYCNGKPVVSLDYRNYPGTGYVRRLGKYNIPPSVLKPGKNVLAIRVYAPAAAAKFSAPITIGGKVPEGGWLATEEYSLPALTAAQQTSLPKPLVSLPPSQLIASLLFNGMIQPVLPYAISGVIWYQGESNAGRAFQYRTAFPLLIADWRKAWQQGDFPFYFCQLANYHDKTSKPGDSSWAELREAQAMTLSVPVTGQAVLIDLGDAKDVHPVNKRDVGERLARIALAKDYGKNTPYSGPVYQDVKFENGKARIRFTHTDGGLVAKPVPPMYSVVSAENRTAPTVRNSPDSELEGFAICGADRQWVWADAKIDGDSVVVWSEKIPEPVAVRYGWADNPTVNLTNGTGLPAPPFRTDDFPTITMKGKYWY